MVDLIVPTVQGREASLERCLASFKAPDVNPIVVPDSKNCGWGWKQGIAASRASYLLLACDDQESISDNWADVCIETVELGLLPCPRIYRPDGSIESQGGDMRAFGHLLARHTKDGIQVDFTTVPFCSREQIEEIDMLPVHYGSDVWVSYRGRQLGYDTVLRHGFDLTHHQEQVARGAGMTQNERDALDIATVEKELERCASSLQEA